MYIQIALKLIEEFKELQLILLQKLRETTFLILTILKIHHLSKMRQLDTISRMTNYTCKHKHAEIIKI